METIREKENIFYTIVTFIELLGINFSVDQMEAPQKGLVLTTSTFVLELHKHSSYCTIANGALKLIEEDYNGTLTQAELDYFIERLAS